MPTVVHGLRDLQRAFAVADITLKRELQDALKAAAEPVRVDAERLAVSRIRSVGVPWSRMRVGVTTRAVYVAPKQRGSRGRGGRHRPKLAPLLMDRAMAPALAVNESQVARKVDDVLATVGKAWDRA